MIGVGYVRIEYVRNRSVFLSTSFFFLFFVALAQLRQQTQQLEQEVRDREASLTAKFDHLCDEPWDRVEQVRTVTLCLG